MSFAYVPCTRPGCNKQHGVVAVKRQHKAYDGPIVSPLRDLRGDINPGPSTAPVSSVDVSAEAPASPPSGVDGPRPRQSPRRARATER